MVGCIISLVMILMFAFAIFALTEVKPSVTPLISIASLTVVVVCFALVNMLKTGVLVAYIFAVTAMLYSVVKNRDEIINLTVRFFSVGNIMFIVSAVFMMIFLSRNAPQVSGWDEFSFWATAAKLVKNHNALYTFYKSSMIGNSTPPATSVLVYFFGWAFSEFSEWACFFAYDVVFLAVYRAVCSVFDYKNQYMAPLLFIAMFILPYFFDITTFSSSLRPVYITTYSEIPLSLLFTGRMSVYISAEHNDSRDILITLPVIAFLTFIKDMGLALSCIAIFIIFFDLVVAKKSFTFVGLQGLWAKVSAAITMLLSTAVPYFAWAYHMSAVMSRNPAELGGETNMSAAGLLLTGVKELLGIIPRSQKFQDIFMLMVRAFFNIKVSMVGSGFRISLIIFAIFVLAFVFATKLDKIKIFTMYLTAGIGFVGYYVFHIFLYVYIFKDNAYTLTSYNRYIYPYYLAWMVLGIICLCLTVKRGKKTLAIPAVVASCVFIAGYCGYYLKPANTFLGLESYVYSYRENVSRKIELISDKISKDDVLFVYSGEDSGYSWFVYTFELADNYIVQEPYIEVDRDASFEEQKAQYHKALRDFMIEKGVTKVIMDCPHPYFRDVYGDRFECDINNFGMGAAGVFNVEFTDDDFFCTLEYDVRFNQIGDVSV